MHLIIMQVGQFNSVWKLGQDTNIWVGQWREMLVGWVLPRHAWIKLNTDGATEDNLGLASGGGLI